jgi:GT2 family glycosyltransferase
MKISVVIPCFNAAHTLDDQLQALEGQTKQPWEVIVADNGSTDGSREVANYYASKLPNFKLVDASNRQGAAHARNVGAAYANGDYLAFCDADDVVDCGWIEALDKAFLKYDFVASRFDHQKLNSADSSGIQEDGLQNFTPPFLPYAGGCGLGIKRTLHDAISGFDETISYLEDTDYCLRAQLTGVSLEFVPEAVISIRHRANISAAFRQAFAWGESFAIIYKRYQKYGIRCKGLLRRLAIVTWYLTKFAASRFKDDKILWKLGWHSGLLRGFVQNQLLEIF